MNTTTQFSLTRTIRDALAANEGSVYPDQVAERIINDLSADECIEALRQALPAYVREVMVRDRTSQSHTTAGTAEVAESPQTLREVTTGARPTPQNRSWKRAAVKAGWERELEKRYATDGRGYVRLADFTYDEVVATARRLRSLAEKNGAQADKFDRISAAMQAAGASKVADLSGDVIRAEFATA